MDFIWSFYIAATVHVKAVQELQQQAQFWYPNLCGNTTFSSHVSVKVMKIQPYFHEHFKVSD